MHTYFDKLSQGVVNLSEIRTKYEIDFIVINWSLNPTSFHVTTLCRYCIPRRFSTPFLKSTLRARLFKSDVYSSDYDESIVESVLLLNYSVVICLGCMLPADLAIDLSNLLTVLIAH